MMKRRIIAIILTAFIAVPAVADNNGGSTYSRYGFGDLRYFTSNRGFAMGGVGIAILSPLSVDRMNPAAWGLLDRTRFSVGALYEGFDADDGYLTAYYGKTHFNGLLLSMPVSPSNGIAVSLGITPYSKVNYNINDSQSQLGFDYHIQYLGEGGLALGHIGASFRLAPNLYIGAKLNYYFGTIAQTITQKLTSTSRSNSEVIRTTSLHGIGMSAGATYAGLARILGLPETHSLNIAAVFTNTTWLTVRDERVQNYTTSILLVSPLDTALAPETKIPLPYSIAAGLAYSTDRILIAADYHFQQWSEVPVTDFNLTPLRNSQRIGAGLELMARRDPLAPFSERVAYRIGAYYNASYLVLNDVPINEYGVAAGIGFPVWGESRINLGAQYGWRGTTENQLQKDRILRISASMNISEFWFNRPEEN